MNFSLHTALVAGLTLALVAMFALGFYWLAAKRRSIGAPSPIAPSPVRGATVQRSAFDTSELDEWEALAHYPDHVLHATQEASAEPQDIHSQYGRPDEAPPRALHTQYPPRPARSNRAANERSGQVRTGAGPSIRQDRPIAI